MSTLAEIQDAVAQLPTNERKALQLWLNSQAEPEMTPQEEERLLQYLDKAVHDIDAGKGAPIHKVHRRLGSLSDCPKYLTAPADFSFARRLEYE